ncbi:hypothetical protein PENTCL1PPCAC_510, partial [Pristionchus entomophagus]
KKVEEKQTSDDQVADTTVKHFTAMGPVLPAHSNGHMHGSTNEVETIEGGRETSPDYHASLDDTVAEPTTDQSSIAALASLYLGSWIPKTTDSHD